MRAFLILFLLVAARASWAQGAPEQLSPPPPPPPATAPPLVEAPEEPEAEPPPPPPQTSTSESYASEVSSASHLIVLEQGERLRVEMPEGVSISGQLVSLMPGALSLKAEPEQVLTILLSDVQELETRKRAPGYGALVGGGLGAASGAVLTALLCIALAEGGDDNAGGCAIVGGVVVGAIGAGVGALVGLALPRWSTVYEREQGPLSIRMNKPDESWFSGKGPVGEVGLQFGYARDAGNSSVTSGWGGRLHLLALLGPYVALGPEVAWYDLGTEVSPNPFGNPFPQERHLFQLGGLARVGMELGPTRTSALLGMGLHDNRSGQLGATVGAEVELALWESIPPVAVDVRYHFSVDRDEFEPIQNFLSFGLGTRLRW
ncbi:porin family protein [Hyalangium versicolor]|uniref:porin family protein n=1 Tax=Hyalangium versicolor TaxID=2861190 RepID=UPI001CCE15CD|nr:porin family protein [Hyalangium versicolor]